MKYWVLTVAKDTDLIFFKLISENRTFVFPLGKFLSCIYLSIYVLFILLFISTRTNFVPPICYSLMKIKYLISGLRYKNLFNRLEMF